MWVGWCVYQEPVQVAPVAAAVGGPTNGVSGAETGGYWYSSTVVVVVWSRVAETHIRAQPVTLPPSSPSQLRQRPLCCLEAIQRRGVGER